MATTAAFTDEDAQKHLDQALNNPPGGIKIRCGFKGSATSLRYRLNHYRARDRIENKGIYPLGHTMHGRSAYDVLELVIDKDDETVVWIRHRPSIEIVVVEPVEAKP